MVIHLSKNTQKMKRSLTVTGAMLFLTAVCVAQVKIIGNVQVTPGEQVYIFEDVTTDGSGTLIVDEEALLHVEGTLVNDGNITFNNAASLMRGSTGNDGTGTGTYFVRRQGSSNNAVYNYWSSPMQSYSGVPGAQTYLYESAQGTQTFTDDQPADPGWVSYSGLMTPGRGYAGRGGGLATFAGNVNNGNVDFPLFYTPDVPGNTAPNTPFNLVGNPYPSGVSCASLVVGNPDISGALYFWADDLSGGSGYSSSDYAVWNVFGSLGTGGGSAAPNGIISTGQGFQVKAITSGATLNFSNSMRVTNTTQFFRLSGEDSRLWFSIEGNNKFNQLLIGILEDATNGEDRLYDATKIRGNGDISLAATNDGKDYCIMAFPPPQATKSVPLNVFVSTSGTYTFSADRMEGFMSEPVFFVDVQNQVSVQLQEGSEIPVYLEAGEYTDRFYLNFQTLGSVGIEDVEKVEVAIYNYQDDLFIQASSQGTSSALLEVFDMNGSLVLTQTNVSVGLNPTIVSLARLTPGVYVTAIVLNGKPHYKKIVKF